MLGGPEAPRRGPREAPRAPCPRRAGEHPRPGHDLRADPPPGLRRGRGTGPQGPRTGLRGQGLGPHPHPGRQDPGDLPLGRGLPPHRVPEQGPERHHRRGEATAGAGGGHPDGLARPLPCRNGGLLCRLRAWRGRHRREDGGGGHDHGLPPAHHGQERLGEDGREGGRAAAEDLLHGGRGREALLLRVPAHRSGVHLLQVGLLPAGQRVRPARRQEVGGAALSSDSAGLSLGRHGPFDGM
mmetsp:Transcript_7218/g.20342  ORF Transcript_7218/g.20342 Transcript_7218/m.20342 type:complete len:240 (-) Transcript_7218:40-759(-)